MGMQEEQRIAMRQEGFITTIRAIPADEWGPGYRIWHATLSWLAQRGPDGTTSIVRVASHIVIIFIAMAVMWFSGLDLPRWDIAEAPASARLAEAQAANLAVQNNVSNSLLRSAVPRTLIPDRQRAQILTHTVGANDTLTAIAVKYQISAETIIWANNLQENPDLLWLEQQLIILPVSGVMHVVGQGETIDSIAKKYKANPADIARLEYNALDAKNPAITAGQKIVVPGGVKEEAPKPVVVPAAAAPAAKAAPKAQAPAAAKPAPGPAPAAVGKFVWPASGAITQRYYSYHQAIDIGGKYRSPVKASDAGKVDHRGLE